MENKDLDNYFKNHSNSFNEIPGEGLWEKIEASMPAPSSRAKRWLLPGAGLVVILGLVAAWLFYTPHTPHKAPAPQQQPHPQEVTAVKDSVVLPVAPQLQQPTQVPEKTQPAPQSPHAAKVEHIESFTPDVQASVASSQKSTTNTAMNEGVMEITITETLTPAERYKLIESTITKNASFIGRKLAIYVKGYPDYLHTIAAQDSIRYSQQHLKNNSLKIEVHTDSLIIERLDTLSTSKVKFRVQQ